MEFGNFGKHCSEEICRQKDFLPFTCKLCEKIYCLDHREPKAHNCSKINKGDIKAIICPTCSKTLRYDSSSMNENEYFEIHYATECKKDYEKSKAEKNKFCEAENCRTKLLLINTYNCENCGKNLCLSHRFKDKHECRRTYRGGAIIVDDSHLFNNKKKNKTESDNTVFKNNKPMNTGNTKSSYQEGQEICEVCNQSFKDFEALYAHVEKAHLNPNSTSKGSINNEKSNTTNKIQYSNCKSEVSREICEVCGQSFANIDDLINHAQRSHYIK